MGARKPNDSEGYRKQAVRKRSETGMRSAFHFAQDCGTLAAFLFYDPFQKKYRGVHKSPPDMPDPDWNEVMKTIISEQVVENGELVKASSRGRKRTTGSARAKPTKVQKSIGDPPRRRGRPRKNPIPPQTPPPRRESVVDVITVAGDESPCSSESRHRPQIQQTPIYDAGTYPALEIEETQISSGLASPVRVVCTPRISTSGALNERTSASAEVKAPNDYDRSSRADDSGRPTQAGPFEWIGTSHTWGDQYTLDDFGFGIATPKFDPLAESHSAAADGQALEQHRHPSHANDIQVPGETTNSYCVHGPDVLATPTSPQQAVHPTSTTPPTVRGSMHAVTSSNLAKRVVKRPNRAEVFAMLQATLDQFNARHSQASTEIGKKYDICVPTPAAIMV
ncbi:hypothetical protein FOXG_14050 [Fusarium oxysporum f. sp. lycopersici 4287]|uniref:Uncharacterized protein n=1 Tax=Fusarium oxysporum f. sp. lycopersici (strain 4287 / CBS 123668 / FGSC 9935 / NRRL 34936) TaxID=426428 RepID=A0A0J9VSI3_FUSO4|nr:hypothetical protein FOXG_12489 [Fusarium oxysporum f. sp. lycopersici 4287]XP_018253588.1 hypothetical protein FOXG_14050 [Fusarium oxysporum f. sp. lycopersici 4287]EWZ79192.1 hypothetical protein FOWG_16640 [Fusarium oxysporum f. sp. lycopersici MN25]KAJ9413052.1 hypothetical protein QL093DRAFT_2527286 [Fusarium oxysporum]KNB13813.1 hypothetical protein FOXG_12489 [Fusarium oxysporum f. sp. lycopersici 4287]KNB15543.1 hypothetical protein FOXG_14050 [Fusarium oxysporum f. sp. lycopersici